MTQVARTSVDPTVIAGIAAIAATQVPGVRLHVATDGLRPPTARHPGLAGSLSPTADPEPPVRSWCEEPGSVSVAVVVEVALTPAGSRPIPTVVEDVRREIAAAMTVMTRLRVARCDVHVADVFEPATPPPSVEPHPSVKSVETPTPERAAPGRLGAARPPALRELTRVAELVPRPRVGDAPAPSHHG